MGFRVFFGSGFVLALGLVALGIAAKDPTTIAWGIVDVVLSGWGVVQAFRREP